VAARVTILRVGALVVLVGQGCAPRSSPVALGSPELTIPPLDAGAYAAQDRPGTVRFGHPVPRTGAGWNVSVRANSHSDDQESAYESDYRVVVLAVDGPAPSRVRLQFTRNVQLYQGVAKATSLDGKEYVVDAATSSSGLRMQLTGDARVRLSDSRLSAPRSKDATNRPRPAAPSRRGSSC
jgi:hypothetical protein